MRPLEKLSVIIVEYYDSTTTCFENFNIVILILYMLLSNGLMFIFFWLNGFAANHNDVTYIDCGINELSGKTLVRCQPICGFYKQKSNSICNTGFNSGNLSYWRTVGLYEPFGNNYIVSKIDVIQDFTIGYLFNLIIIVNMFFLIIILSSKNIQFSYKINYWIFFYTFITYLIWYVLLFEYTVANWEETGEYFLQNFTTCLVMSYVLVRTSIHYTFFRLEKKNLFNIIFYFIVPTLITIHINTTEFMNVAQISLSNDNKWTSNSIIVMTLFCIFMTIMLVFSVYIIYKAKKVKLFLLTYIIGITLLVSLSLLFSQYPFNLSFHLHHYFLAIVLWPLTLFEGKFSNIRQGLLLGLFINGVIRWGAASLWVVN